MYWNESIIDEWATQWWLDNRWDNSVSAGENLRRFREWFFDEEDD
jgi:hypothetical protein